MGLTVDEVSDVTQDRTNVHRKAAPTFSTQNPSGSVADPQAVHNKVKFCFLSNSAAIRELKLLKSEFYEIYKS